MTAIASTASTSRRGRITPTAADVARFTEKWVIDGDCWRWTGHTHQTTGYGSFWLGSRTDGSGCMRDAHRVSYVMHIGAIPEGKVVRQTCRNRWCVKPGHLELADLPRARQPVKSGLWKNIYNMPQWKLARAAAMLRDGHRCTVARFFGGNCTDVLHVHHIIPLEDGGEPFDLENLGTACSRHHPMWEALRARVVRDLGEELAHSLRCRHRHATREARELCERRMARARDVVAA